MDINHDVSQTMLKKAAEKWMSAQDDFKSERFDSCISNLYFAAYQTVLALLIQRGNLTSKHAQVRIFVNRELAHQGRIDKKHIKMFNKLMDARFDADYNGEKTFARDTTEQFLHGVESFNQSIQVLLLENSVPNY